MNPEVRGRRRGLPNFGKCHTCDKTATIKWEGIGYCIHCWRDVFEDEFLDGDFITAS